MRNEAGSLLNREPEMGRISLSLWRISILAVLCGLTAVVLLTFAATRPMNDFVVYWTAPHLFLDHRNPYSLTEVFNAQKSLGSKAGIPIMFLCPPWALSILSPLGLLRSYAAGWFVWVVLLISCTAIGSRLLMDVYFGSVDVPEISYPHWYRFLFAFTFYPTLFAIRVTQASPFLFLGLAGFLYCERRKSSFFAALCLSLSLIKPHLVLFVWVALLLKKEWKMLATVSLVAGALTLTTLLRFPAAFQQYWNLMSGPYPRYTAGGILGGIRAISGGSQLYWIQSIPSVIGLVWVFIYCRRIRNWNWTDQLPMLVTASLLCTPYGFTFDQCLLMIPIIYLAGSAARQFGKIPRDRILLYTVLNIAILIGSLVAYFWAFVLAPLTVAILLWQKRRVAFELESQFA